MSTRVLLVALLAGAALAPLAGAANAESFGVSPPQLTFADPPLLRGGVAEGSLRLQNGFDRDTRVTITPEGEISSWLSADAGNAFTMRAGESRNVIVRVQVPQDAANGEWAGLLRIRAQGTDAPTASGASLHVEVIPLVRVLVGGEQVLRFVAESASVQDRAPDAPLVVHVDAVNHGNVRGAPRFELVVVRDDGAEALRETLQSVAIEPGSKARLALATTRGLPKGVYTATLALPPEQGGGRVGPLLFEVRPGAPAEEAAPDASGLFAQLQAEPWGRIGQPVAIRAAFQNDGEAPIASARLTAEVYRGTERVGVVHSDAMKVPVGATTELVAWYAPAHEGAHVVLAYVTYDGVRTAVQETAFDVSAASGAASSAGGGGAGGSGAGAGDAAAASEGQAKTPGPAVALVALAVLAAVALRRR